MSKYGHQPLSFQGLKTVPIQARGGKVRVEHFGKPYSGGGVSAWLDSLPHNLTDVLRRGYAKAFDLNGAPAIHDFETAIAGQTSEDVEAVLPDGSFGAAEETGREFNAALNPEHGFGESLGHHLEKIADPRFAAS